MRHNLQYIILLLRRLSLMYVLFTLSRLIFFGFNYDQFSGLGINNYVVSFLAGLIFDTSAIIYVLTPFILLHIIPHPWRHHSGYQRVLKLYFIVIAGLCLLANLIDTGYYPFNNRRSGVELFGPGKDLSDQLLGYVLSYWYLLIILIGLVWISIHFYPKTKLEPVQWKWRNMIIEIMLIVPVAILGLIGARGGLSLKPIAVFDAARFADVRLMNLTLNTPFQMLITSQFKDLEEKYYMDMETASQYVNPVHQSTSTDTTKRNIILIVLESFGKEYVGWYNHGKGFTPFLDSIAQHSKVYIHAYANGKRSIEGIPAIIASMPTIMASDYINTRFQSNRLMGIGAYLKPLGYDISFYHGCRNGTMGFDNFVALTGSGTYYGLDEYPDKERDFDGNWGIYDGPYLQYVASQLINNKHPFFTTVFTLSSHHPYHIPAGLSGLFPEGTLPIHKAVRYTDYSLRQFFTTFSKSPVYSNTLFIITADHSAENEQAYYQSAQGKYEIPLLVFDPANPFGSIDSTTVQQTDIMPLILDRFGKGNYFAFGNAGSQPHFAIQYVNGFYQLIQWPWVYQFDGNTGIGLYHIPTDSLIRRNRIHQGSEKPLAEHMDTLIKAFIQQYNHALIHNQTVIN